MDLMNMLETGRRMSHMGMVNKSLLMVILMMATNNKGRDAVREFINLRIKMKTIRKNVFTMMDNGKMIFSMVMA